MTDCFYCERKAEKDTILYGNPICKSCINKWQKSGYKDSVINAEEEHKNWEGD